MKFKYEGFRQGGTTMRGEVEAGTKEQACEKLRLEGIYLQQIVPLGEVMNTVLPDPKGTGPSEPAFLDTRTGSASGESAFSDSAFIPAVTPLVVPAVPTVVAPGFTGVPRETPQQVTIEVMKSFPEEGQFKAGSPPEAQETSLEPWQKEFKAKMEAFTLTMEELKKYVDDKYLLREVSKENLASIVSQTWNNVLRPQYVDDTLGETKESHAEKTKRKKK